MDKYPKMTLGAGRQTKEGWEFMRNAIEGVAFLTAMCPNRNIVAMFNIDSSVHDLIYLCFYKWYFIPFLSSVSSSHTTHEASEGSPFPNHECKREKLFFLRSH